MSGLSAAAPPLNAAAPSINEKALNGNTLDAETQIRLLRAKNHRVLPLPVQALRSPANPLPNDSLSPTLEIVLPALDPKTQQPFRRRQLRCFDSQAKPISSTWLSDQRFRVKSHRPLPEGSSQYICTLPTAGDWLYWHSHTWIRSAKNTDTTQ